jgi:hypothetical protein
MRLEFACGDPVGGPVTVEFEVVHGQVRCWAGDAVVLLDCRTLARWLQAPHDGLSHEGVTFEQAQTGVVFAFLGRLEPSVIGPGDVAELAALVEGGAADSPDADGGDAVLARAS